MLRTVKCLVSVVFSVSSSFVAYQVKLLCTTSGLWSSALQVVVRFVMSALLHTAYAMLADTSYTFVAVTFCCGGSQKCDASISGLALTTLLQLCTYHTQVLLYLDVQRPLLYLIQRQYRCSVGRSL